VRLADLLATPLVLMDRESSVRRLVDAASASIGRLVTPAYEVAFMATAIGLVRAGLGATLLPSSASELRDSHRALHPRDRRARDRAPARPDDPASTQRFAAVEAFVAVLGEVLRMRKPPRRRRDA
jgi:DNA-binding transcriptional LysR family regulator